MMNHMYAHALLATVYGAQCVGAAPEKMVGYLLAFLAYALLTREAE